MLRAELEALGDRDADMTRVLEAELLSNAVQGASAHAALANRQRPHPRPLRGATRGERRLLMVLALEALLSGEPRERGVGLARRALAGAPPIRDEPAGSTVVIFPIAGLTRPASTRTPRRCSTGSSRRPSARARSSAT